MTRPLGFEGIMPLARKLGELTGRGPNCPKNPLEALPLVETRVARLNPAAWGFNSQAEMDAAFAEQEG